MAKVLLHLAAFVLAAVSLATPVEAMVLEEPVPIPTALVLPLDPSGRPSPVCSQCSVVTKTAPSLGDDAALVSFTFVGQSNEGFSGSVRIKVLLEDGSSRLPYASSLSIDDEETRVFELHADLYDFEWPEVEKVYFELVNPS